jgi:hypothetical protein
MTSKNIHDMGLYYFETCVQGNVIPPIFIMYVGLEAVDER